MTGKACGFWKRRHGGNEGNCYPFVKVHGSESHTYVYELSLLWHTAFSGAMACDKKGKPLVRIDRDIVRAAFGDEIELWRNANTVL